MGYYWQRGCSRGGREDKSLDGENDLGSESSLGGAADIKFRG